MESLILKKIARLILQIMLVLSVLLVLRGHNYPGGGFIGGLLGSSGLALYTLAYGLKASSFDKKAPKLIMLGMVLFVISVIFSWFFHLPTLTGVWGFTDLLGAHLKIGTPVLFDFGVYFIVLGSVSWVIAEME